MFHIKFSSKGLQNLASIKVRFKPFFSRLFKAFWHSCKRAPKLIKAISLPSLITLPFPISIFSLISGSLIPIPVPRGYLKADGLSLMSTEVLIIFTNSDSSLGAITTKLGKVDR